MDRAIFHAHHHHLYLSKTERTASELIVVLMNPSTLINDTSTDESSNGFQDEDTDDVHDQDAEGVHEKDTESVQDKDPEGLQNESRKGVRDEYRFELLHIPTVR